ncbi:MAG: acyl-CoA desaturase [Vicingus serpentipes]|nr:acyl-CoA desaturase [Vicingus serpentipes]
MKVVKFNIKNQPEFFKELRKRVNTHFKEKNISKYANFNMKFKTGFMLCLYFLPLILMLTGVITSLWLVILMWVLMGFGMAGIGLSIMHDANHGSYSKNQKVNNALGYLIHFIGGFRENWKIQHNILHHSFTNIEGFDEDIKFNMMRFSPTQKRRGVHRFQVFYAPVFYGFMTMYWLTSKDFQQLINYNKQNLLAGQGLTLKKGIAILIFHKTWYLLFTLILPMILIPLAWWQVLIGFLIMHYICGLILAFVFQSAHIIEATDFYEADKNGSVENNWAIHQMKTTSNFAGKSIFFSWFIGGLNYQIEHHLFPNICHIHYSKIAKIVKQTAKEFNVPYYQHKTFFGALKSHFTLLHQLGTGKYDKALLK